jgi:hypothetical protein
MIPAQPTNADNHRPLRDMNPSETAVDYPLNESPCQAWHYRD